MPDLDPGHGGDRLVRCCRRSASARCKVATPRRRARSSISTSGRSDATITRSGYAGTPSLHHCRTPCKNADDACNSSAFIARHRRVVPARSACRRYAPVEPRTGPANAGRRAARCRSPSCREIDVASRPRAHRRPSSSDEFEGRGPGTEGRRAHRRLPHRSVQEDRPEAGQHRRHLHPERAARRHHAGAGAAASSPKARRRRTLRWKDDVVAWTKHVAPRARARRIPSWCSSATASSRPNSTGTTTRASTSKARRWSCWSTIRRCRIPQPAAELDREDVRRQGDDLLRPLDLQVRDRRRRRARPAR